MEYNTAKNKRCGGELGNKPEACQVLDFIYIYKYNGIKYSYRSQK